MSEIERRRYVRVPLSYVVKCEKYIFVSGSAQIDAQSKNISESGMLFEAEAPYAVGDTLKLEIFFPEAVGIQEKIEAFNAVAKVVRSEKRSDGMFDVAVNFTGLCDVDRNALQAYVQWKLNSPAE